jgi:hypothetical protein
MGQEENSLSGPEILLDENFTSNDSFFRMDSFSSGLLEPYRVVEVSQRDKYIDGEGSVEVSRSRRMVIAMLLLTAALVITTTYIFLSREETDEFEKSVRFCMLRRKNSNKRITAYPAKLTHTLCFVTTIKMLLGSTVTTE